MIPWCEAKTPIIVTLTGPGHGEAIMVECKAPAVASYTFYCAVCRFEGTRSACADHDPIPATVGCWYCLQRGEDNPLTWTIAEVARQT